MIILGIKCTGHDTGAAIISDESGEMRSVAIAEARLNREKSSARFPIRAIDYCLRAFGLESLDEVDYIARDYLFENWPEPDSQVGRILAAKNTTIGTRTPARETYLLEQTLKFPADRIVRVNHIDSHAASTYFVSGYDDAAVLTMEGGTGIYHGQGNELHRIDRLGYAADYYHDGNLIEYGDDSWNSARFRNTSILFDTVTEKLGYDHLQAGKTMALAAFAEQVGREKIVDIPMGRRLDFVILYGGLCDRIKEDIPTFDVNASPEGPAGVISPLYANLAADVQTTLEDDMIYLARLAREKTGASRLCLAGGTALSCVANRKVYDAGLFDEIFVQPAASDEGIPFGAALWLYHEMGGKLRRKAETSYLGHANDTSRLPEVLDGFGFEYSPATPADAAKLIHEGNIIARVFGGSEYGPRALGNRSILADPRGPDMQERVNSEIKHRESYRPFAPSVHFDKREDYFELPMEAPFMIMACQVRPDMRDTIPAVVHVDGSSRPQTVRREQNAAYYELIEEFGKLSGVYVLLNTSFNDDGEPIAETYEDALISFLRTGLDYLYVDEYLVKRPDNTDAILDKVVEHRAATLKNDYARCLEQYYDTEAYARIEAELKDEERNLV